MKSYNLWLCASNKSKKDVLKLELYIDGSHFRPVSRKKMLRAVSEKDCSPPRYAQQAACSFLYEIWFGLLSILSILLSIIVKLLFGSMALGISSSH